MLQIYDPTKPYLKRTIQPRYFYTQATPKSGFLDPAWNRAVPIWPGMAFMRTAGIAYAEISESLASGDITSPPTQSQTGYPAGAEANYTLINGTGVPTGLVANYIGGDGIDELIQPGVNALGVWVMGPDAEFEIQAPAFDSSLNWSAADPGNGTDVFIYARTANLPGVTGLNGLGGPLGTTGMRGQLIIPNTADTSNNSQSGQPVAVLLGVESTTSIIVGGLPVRYPLNSSL